jgi:Permuted papain-like amidase enzyme, YaeF/YiiX, C92 family
MWKLVGLIVLLNGGRDNLEPTDRLTPKGWLGNPWGPAAYRARDEGKLPLIAISPSMARWDDWGKKTLRDGDILFRRGDARILYGRFPMSRFIANVSGSPFSHTGIAVFDGGKPFVYDTTKSGVRRQPLSVWILDNAGPFGVRRLKPAYQDHVPKVISWCREMYAKQVPFDYDLGLDDSELYCVEMTEKAFRASGLTLSEPVRLGEMENAARFPINMFAFSTLTKLRLDMPVFFPGNERHGIWSSPLLETVVAPKTNDSAVAGLREAAGEEKKSR